MTDDDQARPDHGRVVGEAEAGAEAEADAHALAGDVDEHIEAMTRPRGFFCTSCGTSLIDVNVEGLCPSCGVPVANSFRTAGAAQVGPTSGHAIASLVCGIVAVVGCCAWGVPGVICGPIAIMTAATARKRVREGTVGGSSEGLATAGNVLGIVGTVLGVLGVGLFAFTLLVP